MQNMQPLAEIAPQARKPDALLRIGYGEDARVDMVAGSAGHSHCVPRMSVVALFLCCAILVVAGNVRAQDGMNIEFGNNLGDNAFDGVCDDPRFRYLDTRGSAPKPSGENMFRDAADCREVFGRLVELRPLQIPGMEIGDDASIPNGRCENRRFVVDPRLGENSRSWHSAADDDRGQDAQDCFHAWLAGEIWPLHQRYGIAFGDDNGMWANDGTCDDPRFEGKGRSGATLRDQVLRDMTDCIEAYENARIDLTVHDELELGIDFGDDTGSWSFDGECDDPRFDGSGMSEFPSRNHLERDAIDCYRAYRAGDVVLLSEEVTIDGFKFGNDNGSWPFDGECDDPRFEGDGVAEVAREEMGDATDCRRAYRAGNATISQ